MLRGVTIGTMMQDRKILILGSDQAAMFPLASGLRRGGWLVMSAQDTASAMDVARKQRPAAVVLDSQLAGGGGLATLKRLRSSISTTLIPVICIVPSNSAEKEELISSGAQELVEPPGDPAGIDAALRHYLGRTDAIIRVLPAVLGDVRRVEELKRSQLLDSPKEEWYDRLTSLATRLIGAPIALISVVDTDRQFFKSQVGLAEPLATRRETPLSHSFCQWVAGGHEELVVGDAREHPVLRTNAAVRELNVVAYAGVPFSLAGGSEALGSFCVVDSKPREWAEGELTTLRNLSAVVQSYIALGSKAEDRRSIVETVANGIGGAVRLLLAADDAERRGLSAIIEQQSHRLVQLFA